MNSNVPSRFRNPVDDPDPVLAKRYQSLFARRAGPPLPAQVELLKASLMVGDPLMDAWLARADQLSREDSTRMMEQAIVEGIDRVASAPAELSALFRQVETVPLWVDPRRLVLGARVSRRAGILGHFVLADFGLMGGYRSAAVAKTLIRTGKLRDTATERLIQTGRFVTAVTEPGDMLPGKPGYAFTIRVRMVHARVRSALSASPEWSDERWGLPINQSDTLGTNLLFSIGFIEGCRQWGLRFTDEEIDAVVHLWRYVGYLIGIDERLLPGDAEAARRALYLVGTSQPDPDADSVELARALYRVPFSFAHGSFTRRIVRAEVALRLSMTRRILGDEAVDQLGLPKGRAKALLPPLIGLIAVVERAREVFPFGDEVAFRIGNFLIERGEAVLDRELRKREARAKQDAASSRGTALPVAAPLG
ncbi:MAG: hypothetical protein RLZZ450_174 [Pseudomonadota bacterium]|jgi:hypothetical protein